MARVLLENIKRIFNNVTAIEDISLEIPDSEFWVLVGPSGCGKSTILRTIAGLETATSGNLYIGDKLMNDVPARKRDVAMVFQNYALYPHMTVRENIAFGLQMRQVDRSIIQARVMTVAQSLGLGQLLDRKPKQLSGGQQQRVALGRAIARQPQVFLLDEPLSNLDAQLRDDTRAELKELHQNIGITTIYVTHDQTEAMTLADKIVVLDGGTIQQIGTPDHVYTQPTNRMVATFLGNPPMNIFPGKYVGEGWDVVGNFLPLSQEIQQQLTLEIGQTVDLGIRPEHITIHNISNADDSPALSAEVKVVEPLGRETLIRVGLFNSNVIVNAILQQGAANANPALDQNICPGDRLSLKLDLEKLFVFNPNTGDRMFPN